MVEPFNTLNAIFNSLGAPYHIWVNGVSRKPNEIFISGTKNKANYDVTFITIYAGTPGVYYTHNGVYVGYFDSVDTLYATYYNSFTLTIYQRYYNLLNNTLALSPTVSTVIYTDDEYSESRVKGKKIKSLKEKLKKAKRKLKKLKEKIKSTKAKKGKKDKKEEESSSESSSDNI